MSLADITAVLDRLNVPRAGFCAWGLACAFVLAFAARYPARVSRLVIGEANLGDSELSRALYRVGDSDESIELRTRLSLVLGGDASDDAEPLDALHDSVMRPNAKLFLDLIRTMDLSGILAKVEAPTLFVNAAADALMPISTA